MDASGDTPRSSSVHFSRREGLPRKALSSFAKSGLSAGLGFLVKNEKIEQLQVSYMYAGLAVCACNPGVHISIFN